MFAVVLAVSSLHSHPHSPHPMCHLPAAAVPLAALPRVLFIGELRGSKDVESTPFGSPQCEIIAQRVQLWRQSADV